MTRSLCVVLSAVLLASALPVLAQDKTLRTFRKIVLSDKFYCEGVTVADVNKDGKPDLIAGPFWFEGPDFQKRHAFAPAKEVDPHGYSAFFLTFSWDIDGDGYADILVFGFPGQEARWYRNPGPDGLAKDEPWKMYEALRPVDSESPTVANVLGDGKMRIICGTKGQMGWAAPAPGGDPTKPWAFHAVEEGKHGLAHGCGVGDVNSDGKLDLLAACGWWEQPAANAATSAWTFHAAKFGDRGGAQMFAYDVTGGGKPAILTSIDCHGYGLAAIEQTQKDGKVEWVRQLFVNKEPADSPYGVKFTQHHAMELVDIDGDGVKDLVTGKRFWAHGPTGDAEPAAPCVLYWFRTVRPSDLKSADAALHADFVPYLIDSDSGVGTQIWVGDLGTGLPDIVVGNKKGIFLFRHEAKKVSAAEWDAAQPKKAK